MTKFDPTEFTLSNGKHTTPEDGTCLLEAVSWLSGETFTDHPACVGSVLAEYGRIVNDSMEDDATRNKYLIPLIPLLIGTSGSAALEQLRMFAIVDFTVRELLPMVLDKINYVEDAEKLRKLEPITDKPSATALAAYATYATDATDAATDAAADAAAGATYAAAAAAAAADAARAARAAALAALAAASTADAAADAARILGADTVWTMVVGLIERLCAMKDCD